MVKIKNKSTGQIVEAIGAWKSSESEVAVLSGQPHPLTDKVDSSINFDLEFSEFDVWDEASEEYYDVYVVPDEWEIVE